MQYEENQILQMDIAQFALYLKSYYDGISEIDSNKHKADQTKIYP